MSVKWVDASHEFPYSAPLSRTSLTSSPVFSLKIKWREVVKAASLDPELADSYHFPLEQHFQLSFHKWHWEPQYSFRHPAGSTWTSNKSSGLIKSLFLHITKICNIHCCAGGVVYNYIIFIVKQIWLQGILIVPQ